MKSDYKQFNTIYVRKSRRKARINEEYARGNMTIEEREKLIEMLDTHKTKNYRVDEELIKLRGGFYK